MIRIVILFSIGLIPACQTAKKADNTRLAIMSCEYDAALDDIYCVNDLQSPSLKKRTWFF